MTDQNARNRAAEHLPGPEGIAAAFVDSLRDSGARSAQALEDLAAHCLGYGSDDDARVRMRQTGAFGAGTLLALGVLLGTRTGRALLWNGGVVAGAALLGKAAVEAGTVAVDRGFGPGRKRRYSLLASVIARALAGRLPSPDQLQRIDRRLETLPAEARAELMEKAADRILEPEELDELVADPLIRRELFAISAILAEGGDEADQARLDRLARAFDLSAPEAGILRAEVAG